MKRRDFLEKQGWQIVTCASLSNPGPKYMGKRNGRVVVAESITALYKKIKGYE